MRNSTERTRNHRRCLCTAVAFLVATFGFSITPLWNAWTGIGNNTFFFSNASMNRRSMPCNRDLFYPLFIPRVVFYPRRFFEEGVGRPFLDDWKRNLEIPSLLRPRFIVFQRNTTGTNFCQALYYHVHKNGGSTMKDFNGNWSKTIWYQSQEYQWGASAFLNVTRAILKDISHRQQQDDIPIFTFVRDPIGRFLSGVGQVLQYHGRKRIHPCPATSNTTQQLLSCIVDMIVKRQNFLDGHLTPQSYELYSGLLGLDVFVDVMDLSKAIGPMVETMGGPSARLVRPTQSATGRVFRFHLDDSALTHPLKRRICHLYQADVLMLRETGLSVSECDRLR